MTLYVMLYIDKNILAEFSLSLFEFKTYTNNGYLFKLTSDYNTESVSYHIPTVTSENERYTDFEYTFNLTASQYKFEVFNFDADETEPTDETGLTRNLIGTLIIRETETNDIYL